MRRQPCPLAFLSQHCLTTSLLVSPLEARLQEPLLAAGRLVVSPLGPHPVGTAALCALWAAVAVGSGGATLPCRTSFRSTDLASRSEGVGRQVTPFSKRVVLLWFIVLGGRRVGQACGVDGREKEAKCESGDGEGASRPTPKCNMES